MLNWSQYLTGYGLPPAGFRKFDQPLMSADPDCADVCSFQKAQDTFTSVRSALVAAGLDGNYQLVDAIATQAMPQYSISPLAVPGDPAGQSVWLLSAILTATRDLTVQSGDLTLTIKKGSPVQVNEVMGNLAARGVVTMSPGEYPVDEAGVDRNKRQINGGTPWATMETVPTSLSLNINPASTNSTVAGSYVGAAYWVAPAA